MGAWVAGAPLEGGGLGFPWVEIWEPQVSFGFQKKGFQGDLWLLWLPAGAPGSVHFLPLWSIWSWSLRGRTG